MAIDQQILKARNDALSFFDEMAIWLPIYLGSSKLDIIQSA